MFLGFLLGASATLLQTPQVKPTPVPVPTTKPSLSAISALAWSGDGAKLAVGLYQRVAVYDTTSWQVTATLEKVDDAARTLAWSPDNRTLAVGSGLPGRSGKLDLWEPGSAAPPVTVATHTDTVECAAFGKDKQFLMGSADNKGRYIAELGTEQGKVLDQHNGRVQAVAFSTRDNFVFVTGGSDRMVKVWDHKTLQPVVSFDQSEGPIVGLCALPNGSQFVGASLDGRLLFWQVGFNEKRKQWNGNLFRQQRVHEYGVWNLAISRNGQRLATCGADNHVRVWDSGNMRQVADFAELAQPTYTVCLNPDGKTIAIGGKDGLLRVFDAEKKTQLQELTPPQPPQPPAPVVKPAPQTKPVAKTAKPAATRRKP